MKVRLCDFSINLETKEQADVFIQDYLAFTSDENWWNLDEVLTLSFIKIKSISDQFISGLFLPLLQRFKNKDSFYTKVTVSGGSKDIITRIVEYIESHYKKKEVIDKKALSIIDNIKPCSFKYIGDKKTTFGVIAQDLLELFPEDEYSIVTKQPNGFYSVNYVQLIPFLVKEIQLLKERIKNLEES